MKIIDVIRLARELTDRPDATVLRSELVKGLSDIDTQEEKVLEDFKGMMKSFRLISVSDDILLPTLEKCRLESVAFAELSEELKLRNAYYGSLDAFTNPPTVYYHKDLRPCWRRFTVAKELLHLYSGTATDKAIIDANDLITSAQDSRNLVVNESTELDDEIAGFYLAIEVMIPWRLREQFNKLREARATTLQIAKAFMVPQNIVAHFISDSFDRTSNYAGVSRRLNLSI